MKRWIVLCSIAALLAPLSGCAIFGDGSSHSTDGVNAQWMALRDKIYSNPKSDIPVFGPLSDARDAVHAAENQEQVSVYDGDSLREAKQALNKAESDWQAVAGKDHISNAALSRVADEAHRAQRLAQIAKYTAQREVGLKELSQAQNQYQQKYKKVQLQKQRALQRQRQRQLAQQRQRQRQMRMRAAQRAAGGDRLAGRRVVPDMLGSLRFETGTARLVKSSHAVLGKLVSLAHAHQELGLAIFGFTSNRVPSDKKLKAFVDANPKLKEQNLSHKDQVRAYRQGLSLARARDVAELLANAGVDPKRIGVRPMGSSHPVASNDTEQGRQKNARVEVIMVPLKNG